MVTDSGDTVAVTPFGRSTGALAILDMIRALLGHDAQDFAALSIDRACLSVINTLGRDTITVPCHEDLRQLILTG